MTENVKFGLYDRKMESLAFMNCKQWVELKDALW